MITGLLATSGYIITNKALAIEFGVEFSVLLGELCSEYEFWRIKDKLISIDDDCNYFYSTREKLQSNTGITPKSQLKIMEKLITLGILRIQLIGMPAKNYYSLDGAAITRLLEEIYNRAQSTVDTRSAKTALLVTPKWRDMYRHFGLQVISNNNKEIKKTNTSEKFAPPKISESSFSEDDEIIANSLNNTRATPPLTDIGKNGKLFKPLIVNLKSGKNKSDRIKALYEYVDFFTPHIGLRAELKLYLTDFRIPKRGVPSEIQWTNILDDLKLHSKTASDAIASVRSALNHEYMTFIPDWVKNPKARTNFDNTAHSSAKRSIADMNAEERLIFHNNLPRDENGNLVTF